VNETSPTRFRGGTELAHPAVIRLYNGLLNVYRSMRERQKEIDAAFDRVAAQIGFVVTTTLPVRVEVGDKGTVKKSFFDGEALQGTIFEKELSGFLQDLTKKPFAGVPAGTYRFYLIWYEALNLKLRFDWFESVHILQSVLGSIVSQEAGFSTASLVLPEVQERVHWFDPGTVIAIEEALVICAIDEVYPELRLAERISAGRLAVRQLRPPYPQERTHYLEQRFGGKERDILAEVRAILGKQRG
jgi:hypothetical protein